jgi:hypothetical protein
MDFRLKRYVKIVVLSCLVASKFSCSTIQKINRNEKDVIVDDSNYEILRGSFQNKGIESSGTVYNMLYDRKLFKEKLRSDSIIVQVNPIDKESLELSFLLKDNILKTTKLKGKYHNGYFKVRTGFGLFSPLFPLLWGPGLYYMNLGITKEQNLMIMESHSGVAILVVLPFFGSGGESAFEFKRF